MIKPDDADRRNRIDIPLTENPNDQRVARTRDEMLKKTELDTQRALDETGFGKFNYKVTVVTGLICMNVAFSLTSVGFILPSAACDFNMNTVDKGRLSTSPIFGMLCGSCIWGCIADTRGRRMALLNCLFLQAILEIVASIVFNYWAFLVFKFSSGLALSGQMAILYTYVGEFQPSIYREKALSFMEIPWVTGVILGPILAWLIIPLDIELTNTIFSFKSWNLFIIVCGLPAFLIGCILLRLPETPKYLAATGRHKKLLQVLTAMYHENTGNSSDEYIAKIESAGITFLTGGMKELRDSNEPNDNQSSIIKIIGIFFRALCGQMRMLITPPYITNTIVTCLGTYCILASLYTLMLWFPELFQRFADFEQKYPGERTSVCIVSQSISQKLWSNKTTTNSSLISQSQTEELELSISKCDSTIGSQVYLNTLMLGLACIPVAIIFPLCVTRLGFRFYLVFSTYTCCIVTIALMFVTSSTQNLILSCIYEALISVCATVISCLIVELFPTNLRVTASALSSLCGRIGALIGNTMFGYLIDNHCLLLIIIVAVELFVAGSLGFFIPKKKRHCTKKEKAAVDIPGIADLAYTDKYSLTNSAALP